MLNEYVSLLRRRGFHFHIMNYVYGEYLLVVSLNFSKVNWIESCAVGKFNVISERRNILNYSCLLNECRVEFAPKTLKPSSSFKIVHAFFRERLLWQMSRLWVIHHDFESSYVFVKTFKLHSVNFCGELSDSSQNKNKQGLTNQPIRNTFTYPHNLCLLLNKNFFVFVHASFIKGMNKNWAAKIKKNSRQSCDKGNFSSHLTLIYLYCVEYCQRLIYAHLSSFCLLHCSLFVA